MKRYLRLWQVLLLAGVFVVWQVLSQPGLLPPSQWQWGLGDLLLDER